MRWPITMPAAQASAAAATVRLVEIEGSEAIQYIIVDDCPMINVHAVTDLIANFALSEPASVAMVTDVFDKNPMLDDTYAVILAGGSGTRFWPLSRNATPKQLLRLFDDSTLLEQSIARLDGLIPRQNILVLTNWEQEAEVRAVLKGHPQENIIVEPEKRDTGPAVALGIGWVAARNPGASMAVLPADHIIKDAEEFRRVLRGAVAAAQKSNALVTIGIKPTWACPSYGYIERGQRVIIRGQEEDVAVYEVARFREKPNAELAEEFLSDGQFVWNAGMFVWCLPTVVAELTQHCPELAHFINELRQARDPHGTVKAQFGNLPRISIDYALMEKASRVLNIEATFDWDDVGSWMSVAKYFPRDAQDNAARATVTPLDASGNIVFSSEPAHIALLGVKDLIVVQTREALLIADKHSADSIKKLVERVPKELW